MTLSDLLVSVSSKAGIAADSDLLKEIVSNVELTKVNVPDELSTQLNKNLHSLASAKAALVNTIRAESLNSVDKTLSDYLVEDGWDADSLEEVNAEKNTFKRIGIVLNKIKSLESEKSKSVAGDGTKAKGLQDKINELQSQLSTLQKNHASELENKSKSYDEQITNYILQSILSSYQYGIPVDDADAKLEIARTLVQKSLQNNQAKLINDNGQLKLVSNDGTDYFDKTTNTMKSAKDIIEGAIAPILKKHDGATSTGSARQQTHQQQTTHTENVNNEALALLDASIAQAKGV